MEKFTASNGITVSVEPDDDMFIERVPGVGGKVGLVGLVTKALREFFLHERDQELGRWRWPENPDYVVYPIRQRGALGKPASGLLRESSCDVSTHGRNDSDMPEPVRAYFAAHPEPKPWHDAKPGEVWEVANATGSPRLAWALEGGAFMYDDESWVPRDAVTAGRRIWPEVSDG